MRWEITREVGPTQGNQSLRDLLQRTWLLPRRFVHYLRVNRAVTVNGIYQSMNTLVKDGMQVHLAFTGEEFRTPESHYVVNRGIPCSVLYENQDLMVVNKPRGLKSHPNWQAESQTMMNAAAGYLADHPQAAPYMVHRLDQQTSGAMIIAKNPIVVPILDRNISLGRIKRRYVAVVQGQVTPSAGTWTQPIGRDPQDRRKRMVAGKAAQPAVTHYRVLRQTATATLLALTLETGRTHQLRVHCAANGHPIIGDPLYFPGNTSQQGLMLHGIQQRIVIPFTNEWRVITAPYPEEWPQAFREKLTEENE